MKITEEQAKQLGVSTHHETMPNGEHRYRLLHTDGSSYCRTEANTDGWQKSHYHKGVLEYYAVQKGWIAFAESRPNKEFQVTILNEGESITVEPLIAHNIFMSKDSVIHTVKIVVEKIKDDWIASPELDRYTQNLKKSDLLKER